MKWLTAERELFLSAAIPAALTAERQKE